MNILFKFKIKEGGGRFYKIIFVTD